jgi:hypothetical protein
VTVHRFHQRRCVLVAGLAVPLFACALAACSTPRADEASTPTTSPPTTTSRAIPTARRLPAAVPTDVEGLVAHTQDGLTLDFPSNATIAQTSNGWSVRGPYVAAAALAGPAYEVSVRAYDNPDGRTAEAWARDRILADWRDGRAKNEPSGAPVNEPGVIDESLVGMVEMAGQPAFRAKYSGFDHEVNHDFIARGTRVFELVHDSNIVANVPFAPLQNVFYDLILGTLGFQDAANAQATATTLPSVTSQVTSTQTATDATADHAPSPLPFAASGGELAAYALGPGLDPDGVLPDKHGLYLVDPSTDKPAKFTPVEGITDLTWSHDGERLVVLTATGDGRDVLVRHPDGSLRSVGPEAMAALYAAASPGVEANTVNLTIVDWYDDRRLLLRLEAWAAGHEPANLPPVEATLNVDTGAVAKVAAGR